MSRPARRALIRWSWRLFRHEWRQQLLVLALLTVAVAATTFGVAIAANGPSSLDATFGSANYSLTWPGADPRLAADVAAARKWFGQIEVIEHQSVKIPGSLDTTDLRAQAPDGRFGYPMLALDAGRYPVGTDQVAVTAGVAAIYRLHIGSLWRAGGHVRRVVGIVENPQNLLDNFALVVPGQVTTPATVTVLLDAAMARVNAFNAPASQPAIQIRPPFRAGFPAVAVLAFTSIGLLFVGLVAIAGFAVMAGRRLRALGMLGAIGATARHVRLVMLANGLIVGAIGAVAGVAAGLAGWFASLSRLETLTEHRLDGLNLPWLDIAGGMVLAVVAATAAAWWPARTSARVPITAALSGRVPRPRPGHRFAVLGGLLLAAGLGLLVLASHGAQNSHHANPLFTAGGLITTALGVLLLGPLTIQALAAVGRRAPIAIRLALRDLVRYQARSGAALAAIALALGICGAIAISAARAVAADSIPPHGGNLPPNELIVYLSPAESPVDGGGGVVPIAGTAELRTDQAHVDSLVTMLHARNALGLDVAIARSTPNLSAAQGGPGKQPAALLERITIRNGSKVGVGYASTGSLLYVAAPAVLAFYGVRDVNAAADVLTSGKVTGNMLGDFANAPTCPGGATACTIHGGRPHRPPTPSGIQHPVTERIAGLPAYSSAPGTLITMHAIRDLRLKVIQAAWLVRTPLSLTSSQIVAAEHWSARFGLTIETRQQASTQNLSGLATESTAIGVLLALGVLAMTIGLIRSETSGDLRTLTATGSSGRTRRTLTAATAGSLGLLGALLGIAGCYVALIAWDRGVGSLTHVPYVNLAIMIAGLPAAAAAAGWLLAGREPTAVSRQPMT